MVNPADYSDHPDATFQVEKNIQMKKRRQQGQQGQQEKT
jgi:hypothetical protein